MMNTKKLLYRPVGMASGVVSGFVAGVVFKQVWKKIKHEEKAPKPLDEDREWGEVLMAAALEGAIVALVKAAVDRAAATGIRQVTGLWPV